jgi:pimeloyl-ACP methyl ester carboxylesterase
MKAIPLLHRLATRTAKLSIWQKFKVIWFTLVSLFFCWTFISYQPRGIAEEVMRSNEQVIVTDTDDFISFSPARENHSLAYIFYPGAMVSSRSYAPYARAIAQHGYKTIIVKMPLRLASFDHTKALQMIRQNPQVQRWAIGGHSLGGSKAAQFAFEHVEHIKGLILIGTSHPREINMSALPLDVTKIYASHDGLASVDEVMQYKSNLPLQTQYVEIQGGNHAQFGWYGSQLGDGPAVISREIQQDSTIKATLTALRRIAHTPYVAKD